MYRATSLSSLPILRPEVFLHPRVLMDYYRGRHQICCLSDSGHLGLECFSPSLCLLFWCLLIVVCDWNVGLLISFRVPHLSVIELWIHEESLTFDPVILRIL